MYKYETNGVCARAITFELNDNKVTNVEFDGGCHGNRQAVSALVEGMEVEKLTELLGEIDCKGRGTSCAAELVKGIHAAINNEL